ncbi:MAG: N-acetylmuramoyl-L-alanine amidase-like domain-containing protein, partial [Bacteroidota bacterium]
NKKEKIKTSEAHFKTGDIVAITSNVAGLDYAHTGLIYKKNGKSLFMHASSSNKKVIIDCTISEYVRRKSYPAEITILRPLSLV